MMTSINPKEISHLIASGSKWENIVTRMIIIAWSPSDVIPPFVGGDNHHSVVSKMICDRGVDIRYALTLTNFIDSIVGEILDNSTKTLAKSLSGMPFYNYIRLFLSHQESSEIVHQIVYKLQFEYLVPEDVKDQYSEKIINLLKPLSRPMPDETAIIMSLLIEAILIPIVFSIINDFRDLDSYLTDESTNQLITMVLSANKLILRDELTHVIGGITLIQDLERYGCLSLSKGLECHLGVVGSIADNMINSCVAPSNRKKYIDVKNNLVLLVKAQLQGKYTSISDYQNLSFISASLPSIDGFFHGTATSYLNGSKENLTNIVL